MSNCTTFPSVINTKLFILIYFHSANNWSKDIDPSCPYHRTFQILNSLFFHDDCRLQPILNKWLSSLVLAIMKIHLDQTNLGYI